MSTAARGVVNTGVETRDRVARGLRPHASGAMRALLLGTQRNAFSSRSGDEAIKVMGVQTTAGASMQKQCAAEMNE